MMKMDGMKWVAKNMLRRSDLATVVIDQKTVQELINGKLISSLNDGKIRGFQVFELIKGG